MTEPAGNTDPSYVSGHGLLDGLTIVVTAAAGAGIGLSTARRCLEEGAQAVLISDVHERRLQAASDQLRDEFGEGRVPAMPCDVTKETDVTALLDAAEILGGVDVMINNAGLGGSTSILEMTDEQWFRVLDVTLNGTFRCIRAAARRMVAAGRRGVIVNNASIQGWKAVASQAHYAAAKAGVMALTRCAAMDLASHGIRVNAVSPSLVLHPFLERVTTREVLEEAIRAEALGRSAEAWEVANVIVFLASPYASYMTGEVVSVSAQHP
jgi:3-oxoacyl-[acyl-carrier protein] reductase